jgi:hypothetical protein
MGLGIPSATGILLRSLLEIRPLLESLVEKKDPLDRPTAKKPLKHKHGSQHELGIVYLHSEAVAAQMRLTRLFNVLLLRGS